MIFKNHGAAAGASARPPALAADRAAGRAARGRREEMKGARKLLRYKERCVFCDIVRQELQGARAPGLRERGFVVLRAVRAQVSLRNLDLAAPHRARFENSLERGFRGIGQCAQDRAAQAECGARRPALQLHPAHRRRSAKAIPNIITGTSRSCRRLMQVAGFEWGSGFYINPTPPEEAAKFLREIGRLMRILHVASEVAPYSKTGGLADVLGALPRALARARARGHGGDAALSIDRSRALRAGAAAARPGDAARRRHRRGRRVRRAGAVDAARARVPRRSQAVVRSRRASTATPGGDYADNARRFALLGAAALALAAEFGAWPDVVHGHDWQAGPAMLFAKRAGAICRRRRRCSRCTTWPFKGCFPRASSTSSGCPRHYYNPDGFEYLRAGQLPQGGAGARRRVCRR